MVQLPNSERAVRCSSVRRALTFDFTRRGGTSPNDMWCTMWDRFVIAYDAKETIVTKQ